LKAPAGLAVDNQGNVYIADVLDSRVRKVSPQGIITTVAGNGSYGFGGDGGPAKAATLNEPSGVTVDSHGVVYIADTDNNRVREVGTDQTITTRLGTGVAGTGPGQVSHPTGLAIDDTDGFYIADTGSSRVLHWLSQFSTATVLLGTGQGNGPKQVNRPLGITVDSKGTVFVADSGNNRITAVTVGYRVRSFAGTGSAGFFGDDGQALNANLNGPSAVVAGPDGTLYVADQGNNRVRRILSPTVTAFAGVATDDGYSGDGGPATQAGLGLVSSVAADAAGNVYISADGPSAIRKVSPQGVISTFADAKNAYDPQGMAVDKAGNLYVADREDLVVRKFDPSGKPTIVAGTLRQQGDSGDGGPATQAKLSSPYAVALDPAGDLYILDLNAQRVRKVDTSGVITTFAGTGTKGFSGDGGPATAAQLSLSYTAGIAADGAGNVYVTDPGNGRLRKINATGVISTIAGGGTQPNSYGEYTEGALATSLTLTLAPTDVAVDAAGEVLFSALGRVIKISADGTTHSVGGVGNIQGENQNATCGDSTIGDPASLVELPAPRLALDPADNIYLAECHQVLKIAA
jgi:sugar lactone lactonase YvrE